MPPKTSTAPQKRALTEDETEEKKTTTTTSRQKTQPTPGNDKIVQLTEDAEDSDVSGYTDWSDDGDDDEEDDIDQYPQPPEEYGDDFWPDFYDYECGGDSDADEDEDDSDDSDDGEYADYVLNERLSCLAKKVKPTASDEKLFKDTNGGMDPSAPDRLDYKAFNRCVKVRNYTQPPDPLPQRWDGDRQIPIPQWYDCTAEDFWECVHVNNSKEPKGLYGRDAEDDGLERAVFSHTVDAYEAVLENHQKALKHQLKAREKFQPAMEAKKPFDIRDHFDPEDRINCPSCDKWGFARNHMLTREGCHHFLCYCNSCLQRTVITERGIERRIAQDISYQ